jgi:hypothetical protein
MDRIHLFELEDFDWVPIRDGGTDLLDLAFDRLGFYAGVAPRLAEVLDATGQSRVVDLCSGGGGGTLWAWQLLPSAVRERVSLTLSDRTPMPQASRAWRRSRILASVTHPSAWTPWPAEASRWACARCRVRCITSRRRL